MKFFALVALLVAAAVVGADEAVDDIQQEATLSTPTNEEFSESSQPLPEGARGIAAETNADASYDENATLSPAEKEKIDKYTILVVELLKYLKTEIKSMMASQTTEATPTDATASAEFTKKTRARQHLEVKAHGRKHTSYRSHKKQQKSKQIRHNKNHNKIHNKN